MKGFGLESLIEHAEDGPVMTRAPMSSSTLASAAPSPTTPKPAPSENALALQHTRRSARERHHVRRYKESMGRMAQDEDEERKISGRKTGKSPLPGAKDRVGVEQLLYTCRVDDVLAHLAYRAAIRCKVGARGRSDGRGKGRSVDQCKGKSSGQGWEGGGLEEKQEASAGVVVEGSERYRAAADASVSLKWYRSLHEAVRVTSVMCDQSSPEQGPA